MDKIIYTMYSHAIRRFRTSRLIHRCFFGYYPCRDSSACGAYWDWTTLVIKKAMKKFLTPADVFLDMGTGTVGVLAIFAKRRLKCRKVHAVDYIPEILHQSQKNAERLGLDIQFYRSDLFGSVNERFDVVAFNAPYLPRGVGHALGIFKDKLSIDRFCGGSDGGETIIRFLRDAPGYLTSNGRVILGVNQYHIQSRTVNEIINGSQFRVDTVVKPLFLPVSAYVLTMRQ